MFEYGQDIPLDSVPAGGATADRAPVLPRIPASEFPFVYGQDVFPAVENSSDD